MRKRDRIICFYLKLRSRQSTTMRCVRFISLLCPEIDQFSHYFFHRLFSNFDLNLPSLRRCQLVHATQEMKWPARSERKYSILLMVDRFRHSMIKMTSCQASDFPFSSGARQTDIWSANVATWRRFRRNFPFLSVSTNERIVAVGSSFGHSEGHFQCKMDNLNIFQEREAEKKSEQSVSLLCWKRFETVQSTQLCL